jgi:hypothetical protein
VAIISGTKINNMVVLINGVSPNKTFTTDIPKAIEVKYKM